MITLGASDISERIFKEALPTLEPIILTGKAVASRRVHTLPSGEAG